MTLTVTEQRLVPATIRQEGMIVGSDGHLYAPQTEPQGRSAVTAILLRDAGLDDATIAAVVPKILAAINLSGPKLCSCLHVEGASDPMQGHGYYQCETCGGLCCSERWTGHAVATLRWTELVMQQNRHGHCVMQGLAWAKRELHTWIDRMLQTVPPVHRPLAMKQIVDHVLTNLSHIWHQQSLGNDLYQTMDPDRHPRIFEESADRLAEKLKALAQGMLTEEFIATYQQPVLSPEEALARVQMRKAQYEARKARRVEALPEAAPMDTLDDRVPIPDTVRVR